MAEPKSKSPPTPRSVEEWLFSIVQSARSDHFYGEVIIRFDGGKITRVFRNQSLKPPGTSDSPSGDAVTEG